ncbi:MAG: glycosyltransferase family 39 protein, partial [Nanoarchaeota archaeon]|nr:glycosyltransferase family 39 protein [Nanoarchaeota archaeon]
MVRKTSKEKNEFKEIIIFLKKNWAFIILIAIFLFGLHLRSYHLDYPVIGYHNWKETHYLTEARNFADEGFFKHGFFIPYRDFWSVRELSFGVHGDTFPTISILVAIGFKIFGEKLVVARLVGVLLSSLSILLVYLISKKLTNNELFALTTSFLTAINPLFVFFSHNVQLMNVGLFCTLFGLYYLLKWTEVEKQKYLLLGCVGFALGTLTKYPFIIMAGSLLFIFPYKRLKNIKKDYTKYIIPVLIMLTIPLWMLYAKNVAVNYGLSSSAVDVGAIQIDKLFTKPFWSTAKAYTKDNFTLTGIAFAFIGLAGLLTVGLKKKSQLTKFLFGSFLGVIIFFPVMGLKLSGHSYHYFPIALTIIMLISYLFLIIANMISSLIKQVIKKESICTLTKVVVVIALLFALYPSSIEAKNRQFDTQFP